MISGRNGSFDLGTGAVPREPVVHIPVIEPFRGPG
jgi:hypothetical protein